LENKIGFQIVKDLVITKVRKFGQIKNRLVSLIFLFLGVELWWYIMLRIENLNNTLSNEVHFLDIAFVTDNNFSWSIKSAIHIDDKFISKASFTFIKEMVKGLFEVAKDSCAPN